MAAKDTKKKLLGTESRKSTIPAICTREARPQAATTWRASRTPATLHMVEYIRARKKITREARI